MGALVGGAAVAARVVGIGLPMAAVGAAMHIAELRPRAVVLLGTCGAYRSASGRAVPAALAIGDVVATRRLRLVDPSVLAGASQFPEPMSIATDAHPALRDAFASVGARPADVATTLAITVHDATAERVAQGTGAHVEHLEAHGVATACAARGVPFCGALAVANFVGAHARAEWVTHHRGAALAAVQLVLRWLTQGAPGIDRRAG
jgi:nucleoside phosphorylase